MCKSIKESVRDFIQKYGKASINLWFGYYSFFRAIESDLLNQSTLKLSFHGIQVPQQMQNLPQM